MTKTLAMTSILLGVAASGASASPYAERVVEYVPGTIRSDYQVAESALASIVAEGARPDDPPPPACLVALDPSNGEVLALVSQPGFDPNIFLGGLTPEEYQALLAPDKPQHNRAIASTYPPGSTFKAATSLAGLESGLIERSTTFEPCFGSYQFGNRRFGCWKPSGHGVLSQDGALRQS